MKPQLQAFILADHIYQDRASGKMVICGTFTQLRRRQRKQPQAGDGPQEVPVNEVAVSGSPYAYLRMTGVRHAVPLMFRFVDLSSNKVLLQARIDVNIPEPDPVASYEFALPVPQLPVNRDGFYSLDVLHNDELLGHWRIEAKTETPPEEEDDVHD